MSQSSRQVPLPTVLGESCLTVNGQPVPVMYVSPRQINAQLPFAVDGNTQLVLRTPGGVSDCIQRYDPSGRPEHLPQQHCRSGNRNRDRRPKLERTGRDAVESRSSR